MRVTVYPASLQGEVVIPGSKSHTIRAVAFSALAPGESHILRPLDSADAHAARRAYRLFGAVIEEAEEVWHVTGINGIPKTPDDCINVENSGTTMRIALGTAALLPEGLAVLTGDSQVRRRPCGPLATALTSLGAQVTATRGGGSPPFVVKGCLRGGEATMEAVTSQYVTSVLINAPLASGDTRLHVPFLNEKPYVVMTLDWIRRQGVRVECDEALHEFYIPGGQQYRPVNRAIPADFSSATFFLAAGALPGNEVTCIGLDMTDTQGDKAVVDYLGAMGAAVTVDEDRIMVSDKSLTGVEIDLNATPDALPMMAALACYAEGETRLVNAPQARLKETDRIQVMRMELEKLGGRLTELSDGLVIRESPLHGGVVESHDDHRVVMALAIAATRASGPVTILGAEAIEVTYPGFISALEQLGARVVVEEES